MTFIYNKNKIDKENLEGEWRFKPITCRSILFKCYTNNWSIKVMQIIFHKWGLWSINSVQIIFLKFYHQLHFKVTLHIQNRRLVHLQAPNPCVQKIPWDGTQQWMPSHAQQINIPISIQWNQ